MLTRKVRKSTKPNPIYEGGPIRTKPNTKERRTYFFSIFILFLNIVSYKLDTLDPAMLQLHYPVQKTCFLDVSKVSLHGFPSFEMNTGLRWMRQQFVAQFSR